VRVENTLYGVVRRRTRIGHVTVRARACVDVRCRTQCDPGWKLSLTSADMHLQLAHTDPSLQRSPRSPSWFRSGIPGKGKLEGMEDGWEKKKGGERKRARRREGRDDRLAVRLAD